MIFNKQLLYRFREYSKKYGLRVATLKTLSEVGVNDISKKGTAPATGPLLIVSNHTGLFDTPLLTSQINRGDLYTAALSTFGIFGPTVREKLLPIYMPRDLKYMIFEHMLYIQIEGKLPEKLPPSEIRPRNRKTISRAAELINRGNAVIIFPTGSAGKRLNGAKWKTGVGFLIKQISNPRTKVVFAHIRGTNNSEFFAYFHPILSKLFFKPRPLSIHFSRPKALNKLVNRNDDSKTIVAKLENLYHNNGW